MIVESTSDCEQAYTIHRGGEFARLISQHHTARELVRASMQRGALLCRVDSAASTCLVRIDLKSGAVIEEHRLPRFRTLHVSRGWSLGELAVSHDASVATRLCFVDPANRVVATPELDGTIVAVASGRGHWLVLCANGRVLCFSHHGRIKWSWTLDPMGVGHDAHTSSQALLLAANDDFVIASTSSSMCALDHEGRILWTRVDLQSVTPTAPSTSESWSGVADWGELGLAPGATSDEVKRAYRRHALASHPDFHPTDERAPARFSRLSAAYERVLSRHTVAPSNGTASRCGGSRASVVSLFALRHRILAVSAEGGLSSIDCLGHVRTVLSASGGTVLPAIDRLGTLRASLCDGVLSFLDGDRVTNSTSIAGRPIRIASWGDHVLVAHATSIDVFEPTGALAWSVDFHRRLRSISIAGDRAVFAAGAAFVFEMT